MKKRTKELAIKTEVKKAVAERDSFDGWPCCLLCGTPAPVNNRLAYSCCHYISRSQGGTGREDNILTLCPRCHMRYDQSTDREQIRAFLRRHLQEHYPHWDESKLTYKK